MSIQEPAWLGFPGPGDITIFLYLFFFILFREILSKNICFLRESNLTTSASKSGAGLPNLGNEFDKNTTSGITFEQNV